MVNLVFFFKIFDPMKSLNLLNMHYDCTQSIPCAAGFI